MPRGPLPNPDAVRRNAPTIPTTNLPAGGFAGEIPALPALMELAADGYAWWLWAWRTPQAAGWSAGDVAMVARRASLEDDLATIAKVQSLDALDFSESESEADARRLISRLAALVSGRLAILRECRELDDRLGLSPKGMAALRWKVVEDSGKSKAATGTDGGARGRYAHLAAVPAEPPVTEPKATRRKR